MVSRVRVTALAGGIGAGKFLRGLVGVVAAEDVTVVVNTGDDIAIHGLAVSPDLDSVTYWLGDVFDRERGWGRRGETFRSAEELSAFDPDLAWFSLGDLDLGTHLFRTGRLASGAPLSAVTGEIAARFGVGSTLLPMTDDPVTTRIHVVADGGPIDLHFQEYWVRRHAQDDVERVRYAGADEARPTPGVLESIADADVVVLCPSNPVASLGPILAIPGVRDAVAARRDTVVGISGIVGGAPLAGMADKLMPSVGLEVTASGAASAYDGLLSAWVVDEADRDLVTEIEATGVRVAVTDSIMRDDVKAEALANVALGLVAER